MKLLSHTHTVITEVRIFTSFLRLAKAYSFTVGEPFLVFTYFHADIIDVLISVIT